MKVLALVSDAYGGRGGIALYNRNVLSALCEYPQVEEVKAIPRSIHYELEILPKKLTYINEAAGSKIKYLFACLKEMIFGSKPDLIICGHLHLLPFAYLLKFIAKCRLNSKYS